MSSIYCWLLTNKFVSLAGLTAEPANSCRVIQTDYLASSLGCLISFANVNKFNNCSSRFLHLSFNSGSVTTVAQTKTSGVFIDISFSLITSVLSTVLHFPNLSEVTTSYHTHYCYSGSTSVSGLNYPNAFPKSPCFCLFNSLFKAKWCALKTFIQSVHFPATNPLLWSPISLITI